MRIQRICVVCQKPFIAIKETQIYDSRKCFKKAYYRKNKAKLQYEEDHPSYPQKQCAFCNMISTLQFDPIKYPDLFNKLECPFCHVTNETVWQYQYNRDSHQVISNLLGSVEVSPSRVITYNIQGFTTIS